MPLFISIVLVSLLGYALPTGYAIEQVDPILHGPVAAITTERFSVSERDRVWLRGEQRTIKLVPLGGPLPPGMTPMHVDGILFESVITRFAPGGRLLFEEYRCGQGDLISRKENTYDENGRCVEIREARNNEESVQRTIRKHDSEGRLISLRKKGSDGRITEERALKYDEEGRLVEETRANIPEGTREIHRYSRLENLNSVVIEHYSPDGEFTMSRERALDDQGRTIFEQYGNRDGEPSGYIYRRYDERGRLLETRFVRQGEVEYRSVYRYGEHNHPIEIERSNRRGVIEWRVFAYEFDRYGNWIRRAAYDRTLRSGRSEIEPISLETRLIEYADAAHGPSD